MGYDYLGRNEAKAAILIRRHGMLCNDIFPSTQWPGINAGIRRCFAKLSINDAFSLRDSGFPRGVVYTQR